MAKQSIASRLNTIMHKEGFVLEYSPQIRYEAIYKGRLDVNGLIISVKVCFPSIKKLSLPAIFLDETPDQFPPVTPNYFPGSNYLCYADNQLAYIDIIKLESQIKGCLQIASDLISDLIEGKNPDKTKSEFLVYWQGGDLYYDKDNSHNTELGVYSENTSKNPTDLDSTWLLTSHSNKRYYSNFTNELGRVLSYTIKCENPLVATDKYFPPSTLFELKEWLKISNNKAVNGLNKAFIETVKNRKNPSIALVLEAPNTKICVLVFHIKPRQQNHLKPEKLLFGNAAKRIKISRMGLYPIDEISLILRNSPEEVNTNTPDLSGKKILLIGCGSVGGGISELMARHGAGRIGGKLVLADFDSIKPGNIGRHSLGIESLGENKATALKKKLEISLPKINVIAKSSEMSFEDYDLIIDATGDQSFNQFLSTEQIASNIRCPIIYSWVHGAGVGVQSFIQMPGDNEPCLFCINNFSRGGRFSLLKGDTPNSLKNSTGSCSDWSIPYSAATAIHASALASNQAIEWARGDNHSRINSLLIQHKIGKNVKDKIVNRNKGCDYCAAIYK